MIGFVGRSSLLIGLFIVIVLMAVSVPIQRGIDSIRGKFRSVEETSFFSSSALKRLSLGYKEIIADIYWLRALQYFGGKKLQEQKPEFLFHYFDIITDLDPRFVNAYRYGGTFLAENPPFGLGEYELGMSLLDKGRMNNPDNFRLPLEQGFIAYLGYKNYEKASELFKEASEKPGLSDIRAASFRGMAASALAKGGNRELSREIWKTIYETSPIETRRNFALLNLKELETMDKEDILTEALRRYLNKHNEFPKGIEDLKGAGIIKKIPEEPFGGEFVIIEKPKEVKSSTFLKQKLRINPVYLTSKAQRFKILFGRYPRDLVELKEFIEKKTTGEFPPHPLGEDYVYDPSNGIVTLQ